MKLILQRSLLLLRRQLYNFIRHGEHVCREFFTNENSLDVCTN